MSERLNVSKFAEAEGCDEKQVRRAIERGALHKGEDGLLAASDVKSGWRKPNRRTMLKSSDNRSDKVSDTSKLSESVRTKKKPPVVRPLASDEESPAEAATRLLDSGTEMLTYAEALEKKENYQALLRQIEYEQKSGSLVDLATAENVLFEAARAQRDSWLSWPSRIAPLLAAELGIDEVDRVTEFLTAHVHKHVAKLGIPDADFVKHED